MLVAIISISRGIYNWDTIVKPSKITKPIENAQNESVQNDEPVIQNDEPTIQNVEEYRIVYILRCLFTLCVTVEHG